VFKQFFDVFEFAKELVSFLGGLSLREVYFSSIETFLMVVVIVFLVFGLKVLLAWLKKDKNIQKHSGYKIGDDFLLGYGSKLLNFSIRFMIVLGILGLFLALGNPFMKIVYEEKTETESRIRIDLRDTSESMMQPFPGTTKSKAQVAAEAHLDFLKMRKGKKDRTSFWLFASAPHLVEDFIVDDELYFNQVEDAPWLTPGTYIDEDGFPMEPNGDISEERYAQISGENGGTDIVSILKAVIKQIDQDKLSTSNARKSLLIITDADVYKIPEEELAALDRRSITPLMLFIKSGNNPKDLPELIKLIKRYGGEYFDVSDEKSLKRAFEHIDKFETLKVEKKRKVFTVPIFQKFLLASVLTLFCSVLLNLLREPCGIYP